MKEITITANDAGQRLDRFLKKYFAKAPLSAIYKIIRKDLKLNGRRAKENTFLNEGDVLSFYMSEEEIAELTASPKKRASAKRQFKIAYEDENIIAVEKPFGLLTHGDKTEKKNTLTNQVIDYLIEKGEYVPRLEKSFSPAPAHRLDRNTTGLVLFGKNAESLRELTALMADKEEGALSKYYLAICDGEIKEEAELTAYLTKDAKTNKVKVSARKNEGAKLIRTHVKPLKKKKGKSLVEVELITGRPHQIRAHLAYIGCPVMGDPKYGHGSAQMLHAARLEFKNPKGKLEYLKGKSIECEPPEYFKQKVNELF